MKKIYTLLLLALCFSAGAFAQNGTLTFFTDKGEKFWVLVNGVVQNAMPENNVKVQGLAPNFYRIKIVFQLDSLGELAHNMGVEPGVDYVYIIHKKNTPAAFKKTKGPNAPDPKKYERFVIRPFSASANGGTTAPANNQDVIIYGQGTPLNTETVVHPVPAINGSTTTTTTTTTTTGTQTSGTPKGEFSINIYGDPNNASVKVNADGSSSTVITNSTSTTTTTTTSSSGTTGTIPAKTSTPVRAMGSIDFEKAVASIKTQSFEDNKLTVAKQVLKGNYLNCAQIKTIIKLFSFEQTKLDFAKAAYEKCVEKNNYYLINDAFTFSSSIDELNAFIEGK